MRERERGREGERDNEQRRVPAEHQCAVQAQFSLQNHQYQLTKPPQRRHLIPPLPSPPLPLCSNVLPLEVDLATDYFSDSAPSAVRAVFASWNLDLCKAW